MSVDQFTERLAKVRDRFVSSIESKIDDTYAGLVDLAAAGPAVVDSVSETYRRMHSIAGIAPTLGFAATGRAARAVEAVLVPPYRGKRALAADELDALQAALHELREATKLEIGKL